ncbi:MAG TPA: histidine kinase [Hymenobacter sp.]|uniref:sensor histidine kinase n=1 Tax=Hymenobacter sp. TaxID=1898978 RepID=UPI002ED8DBC2
MKADSTVTQSQRRPSNGFCTGGSPRRPPTATLSARQERLPGSLLIGLCLTSVYYAASVLEPSGFSWVAAGLLLALVYLLWEGTAAVSAWLDRRRPWSAGVGRRLLAQLLLGAALALALINGPYVAFKAYSLRHLEDPGSAYTLPIFLLTNGVTLMLFGLVQGAQLGLQFLSRWRQAELRAERLQREGTQARLAALRQQVSPHFLLNNLNILSVLIDRSPPLAQEFVAQFAQVYRYVLEVRQREIVPLAEELAFARAYVFLQRIRHGDALHITLPTADEVPARFAVPPLCLQLLLENALKHNAASVSKPLHLHIAVDASARRISVRNSLRPRRLGSDDSLGIGLPNLRARYAHLTDELVEVEHTDTAFMVRLPLLELAKS